MLDEFIYALSKDPFDPQLNFNVAVQYEKADQIASAVGFYLRTAEYGKDTHPTLVYASLLKLAKCFNDQNDRLHTVSNCILQAIAYLPYRPEAYFWMSRFHERQGNWQECYTFAKIGLHQQPLNDLPVDCEFNSYCLNFEKAVSGWWIGRAEESRLLFQQLLQLDLTPEYRQSIERNLATI